MKTEERFLWRAVFFLLLLLFFGTNVWELFGGDFCGAILKHGLVLAVK
jgi:hypothetical protein